MASHERELNFELDLLPIISVLSVCICFLLLLPMTANIGVLEVKQAVGEGRPIGGESINPPSLWIEIDSNVGFRAALRDVIGADQKPVSGKEVAFPNVSGRADWSGLEGFVREYHGRFPEMKTAIVVPRAGTSYGTLARAMDLLRRNSVRDIGISP